MLSHEPKNYALLGYDGTLVLRGVAFRSSRAEPFGEAFLRRALGAPARRRRRRRARRLPRRPSTALRRRELPTCDVSSRVRLTKTPARVPRDRASSRRELPTRRCSRAAARRGASASASASTAPQTAAAALVADRDDDGDGAERADPRDYDVEHYVRVLRDTFAARLVARVRAGRLRRGVRRSRPAVAVRAGHRSHAPGAHHHRGTAWRGLMAGCRLSASRFPLPASRFPLPASSFQLPA